MILKTLLSFFMQAIFHREICDGAIGQFGMSLRRPCFRLGHISIEAGKDAVIQCKIFFFIRGLIKARPPDFAQELNRVMTETLPQIIVEPAKDARSFRLPRPPQIVGQFAKTVDALG